MKVLVIEHKLKGKLTPVDSARLPVPAFWPLVAVIAAATFISLDDTELPGTAVLAGRRPFVPVGCRSLVPLEASDLESSGFVTIR